MKYILGPYELLYLGTDFEPLELVLGGVRLRGFMWPDRADRGLRGLGGETLGDFTSEPSPGRDGSRLEEVVLFKS
jgi:hypothetical protein